MIALAAVVMFAIAAVDVEADGFHLPWIIPAGLAVLALHLFVAGGWPGWPVARR